MALVQASPLCIATALRGMIRIFSKTYNHLFEYEHCFKKDASNEEIVDYILFSPKSTYFLALFSDKSLVVWKITDDGTSATKYLDVAMSRRSISAAFDVDESEIYVADKSGDLYKISMKNMEDTSSEEQIDVKKSILGHVSILLDVSVTEKYIITADRDEKIRVSLKKQPFVIHCFCLGHTKFVCKVLPFESDYLLSTSGDGDMCVWNVIDGTLLCKCTINDNHHVESSDLTNAETIPKQSIPSLIAFDRNLNLVAVGNVGENDDVISVYKVATSAPHLTACYRINLTAGQQLVDISFDCVKNSASTLYALIQCEEKITLLSFSCTLSSYDIIQSNTVDYVNTVIGALTFTDARHLNYLQLFKTTIPGHTYDTFYKKKSKQFKKEKPSKKIKLQP